MKRNGRTATSLSLVIVTIGAAVNASTSNVDTVRHSDGRSTQRGRHAGFPSARGRAA